VAQRLSSTTLLGKILLLQRLLTLSANIEQKMIRKMNYREHYYPNQTEHDARDMEVHISMSLSHVRLATTADFVSRPLYRAAAASCNVQPRYVFHDFCVDTLGS
jgi:hypothetical protein